KDKTAQFQEKHDLEPKKNEFELTHNREVKKERSRDQGMSLYLKNMYKHSGLYYLFEYMVVINICPTNTQNEIK
ncbi:TPA: hypothetical protein ACROMI_001923, partial [Staphylococcus aureus]